ncbi:MAG: AmmeMemoRadiSam system protein A [Anaerolineales bacterium]|jgi:AmmeMemoRadiSam system protein A
MTRELTHTEKRLLLQIARDAIQRALQGEGRQRLDPKEYPPHLREIGACFVTLTRKGELRGCVGSIEASQPLVLDVRDRSLAAAFEDPRFPPLSPRELSELEIEISILTPPERLQYHDPADLPGLLRPGVDGVILTYQFRRATFLPQVWEKLPEPEVFLGRLCQKMGLEAGAWRHYLMEVETYQVEMFTEGEVLS